MKKSANRPRVHIPEPRAQAAQLIHTSLANKQPLDQLLSDAEITRMSASDQAFCRAMVYSTLRRLTVLNQLIDEALDRPLPAEAAAVRSVLQVALAQAFFMDVKDHAVVSCAVADVGRNPKLRRYKPLVNGVLRGLLRDRERIEAFCHKPLASLPNWLKRRWQRQYGSKRLATLAAAVLAEPPLDITCKSDIADWATRLEGKQIGPQTVRLGARPAVASLPGYAEGHWWVQDISASLPAQLLPLSADKSVADLCAAPGGKTMQIAATGAQVTAVDISPGRLRRLQQNLQRTGLNAEIVTGNIHTLTPTQQFDCVLLDAPCSATGTIRRHPEIMHLRNDQDIADRSREQHQLLDMLDKWLKPGGTAIYAVCSMEAAEGEEVIAAFLDRSDQFERVVIKPSECAPFSEAVTGDGDLRITPPGPAQALLEGGCDGFFISRLRKRA